MSTHRVETDTALARLEGRRTPNEEAGAAVQKDNRPAATTRADATAETETYNLPFTD